MRELILLNPRGKRGKKRRKTRKLKISSVTKRRKTKSSKKKIMAKRKRRVRRVRRVGSKRVSMRRRVRKAYRAVRGAVRRTSRKARRIGRRVGRRVGGNITSQLKSIISKDNLQIVGGAIGASALNNLVLSRFANSLPMYNSVFGKAAYSVLAPFVLSIAVRKMAPKVADGLVIGGLLSGATQLMQKFAPNTTGMSDYVTSQPSYPMLPRRMPVQRPSVDSSSGRSLGFSGVYDSPTPYSNDAWSN